MAWLSKKKKPKARLEMPPPPEKEDIGEIPELEKQVLPETGTGKIEIPDKFHEVKFPMEEAEEPAEKVEDVFKPVSEVAKPDIPEMPELPEIPELEEKGGELIKPVMPQGPVFIKSNDFQDVLAKIGQIKENVKQTEDIFNKLNDIKNEKDNIFGQWKESLEDVQRKLLYIEKALYEV